MQLTFKSHLWAMENKTTEFILDFREGQGGNEKCLTIKEIIPNEYLKGSPIAERVIDKMFYEAKRKVLEKLKEEANNGKQ